MMQCYWLRIYTNNAGPETVYSVTDRLGIVIVSEHGQSGVFIRFIDKFFDFGTCYKFCNHI